jgi:DNA (cytosine-5)-methyltransferase 1
MRNIHEQIQNTSENVDVNGLSWKEKVFQYPNRTIRIGTTFSGIGAIEHAFQRLGLNFKIQFAGDIEPNCKKAYFANYKIAENRWHNDIHDFNAKPYDGEIDLLVGGAPCQAFSMVGERRGFEDTRGTLFREYARIIMECHPKVFIFENVQGLLTHDSGQTWNIIKHTFEDDCNYDIYFQQLNSKNYGIPQHRERLYCIGFREETEFKYPAPIPLKYRMYDFLEDYTDSQFFIKEKNIKFITPDDAHFKKAISSNVKEKFDEFKFKINDIEDKYYLSEKTRNYVLAQGTKKFKTSTRTDLDIARPMLQTMHKMHRAGIDNYVTYRKDKGIDGIRKLTPRECMRLMGFKDSYNIVVSNTSAYMEAGNSIVVDVLIALLKQLDITQYGID